MPPPESARFSKSGLTNISRRLILLAHTLMNNPQDWIGSKFSVADLHGKTVEYSYMALTVIFTRAWVN